MFNAANLVTVLITISLVFGAVALAITLWQFRHSTAVLIVPALAVMAWRSRRSPIVLGILAIIGAVYAIGFARTHPFWCIFLLIVLAWIVWIIARRVIRIAGRYNVAIGQTSVGEANEVSFEVLGRCRISMLSYEGHSFGPGVGVSRVIVDNITGDQYAESVQGIDYWGSLLLHCVRRGDGWLYYLKPFIRPIPYLEKNDDDGFGEGVSVILGQRQKTGSIPDARTMPGENAVLTIVFTVVIQVVNAYKFRFDSPKTVISEIMISLDGMVSGLISIHTEAEARGIKGKGDAFWVWLQAVPEYAAKILDWENRWGVRIIPNNVILTEVNLDPALSKALQEKVIQSHLADALAIELNGPVERMFDTWLSAHVAHLPDADKTAAMATLRASDEGKAKESEFLKLRQDALAAGAKGGGLTRVSADGDLGGAIALFKAAGRTK